eukprot:COSAG06_NODE_56797_length_283_cov_0.711957_1_plen_47_part_01
MLGRPRPQNLHVTQSERVFSYASMYADETLTFGAFRTGIIFNLVLLR